MNPNDCPPDGLLILPHIRIQGANAISSPLTHGFPSMTAFLGFMWALGRKLSAAGIPLKPEKVGVICHWHEEQTQDGYVKTFCLTRNPVGKDGGTAAIVEEGRIHLDVTLVLQIAVADTGNGDDVLIQSDEGQRRDLAWSIRELVSTMRIAGGSVLSTKPGPGVRITPDLFLWPNDEDAQDQSFRRLRRYWLPGFALVSRHDLLQQRVDQLRAQDPGTTMLDAWLDLSRFNYRSQIDEHGKVAWTHDRLPGMGWVVPIPVGYGSLSQLYEGGHVAHARDEHTRFRFVESVYSIGQWISPHRLRDVRDLLWWSEFDSQSGLYRCCNAYAQPEDERDRLEFLPLPPRTAESV